MTIKITIKDQPINKTFQNVTGVTGGSGDGALFDVTKTDGVYSVALDTAGTNYAAGDTITIKGSNLGGVDVTNNLIVTVSTVGTGGKIATFGSVGTGRVGDGVVDVVVDAKGTLGIDTFDLTGKHEDYTLEYKNGDIIATSDLLPVLSFKLEDYERVSFDDKHIAFDATTDSDLGKILALMTAAVGDGDVAAEYVGAGMYLREELGWSLKDIAAKILTSDEYLEDAGGSSNVVFAKHVWKNTFEREGTYDEIAMVIEAIEKHGYSQADVLMVAANRPELLSQIDFVGIATNGLEYVPYGG